MPGRFELKPTLAKIWQAPDNFRIMDPLPPLHRRGIIIGALMVIVGFLLPSGGDDVDTAPVARNAQLDIQSQARPQPDAQRGCLFFPAHVEADLITTACEQATKAVVLVRLYLRNL